MNFRDSFQLPQQSFPTDVTSPVPTQLPGGTSEKPNPEPAIPAKRPESDRPDDQSDEEKSAGDQRTIAPLQSVFLV
jgi:hypothetical protein